MCAEKDGGPSGDPVERFEERSVRQRVEEEGEAALWRVGREQLRSNRQRGGAVSETSSEGREERE